MKIALVHDYLSQDGGAERVLLALQTMWPDAPTYVWFYNKENFSGTFEGKVTVNGSQINVEGTWKITSGTGKVSGATGGGTFKTKFTPPGVVECSWDGKYELAAKASAA